MLMWGLRGLFVIMMIAVGAVAMREQDTQQVGYLLMVASIGVALVTMAVDLFIPRKSLAALSGAFLGLVVGMVFAFGFALVFELLIQAFAPDMLVEPPAITAGMSESARQATEELRSQFNQTKGVIIALKLLVGIVCCYLAISFVLQTKDDVRFVIPYVEFAKQTRGARPLILDTSVIIDGRIADICDTKIIDSPLVIPRFVLQELQTIADSADKLKRNRGRRGLDMLNKLQTNDKIEIKISDTRLPSVEEAGDVDQKLLALAKKLDGRVVTNDYNLNKIAQLRGVDVININDLANALKPVVLPGETLTVRVIKPGEEAGQGVGYLEDGTMVVAENTRERLNEDVTITVTSVLQTSAGRMIFGRPEGMPSIPRRRPRM
jgi:uncharacterized protein YacL